MNTGGVKLERQEIRSALYRGNFNDLMHEISHWDSFREVWQLPRYVENEIEANPDLLENKWFQKMGDTEVVLRFFALRHAEHYRRGMQDFLDLYTARAMRFGEEDIDVLRELYRKTLNLAIDVFGDKTFRPFDPEDEEWASRPHTAFYDAIMVGLSRNLDNEEKIKRNANALIDKIKTLFKEKETGTFTGRGNTKADVLERINLIDNAVKEVIS